MSEDEKRVLTEEGLRQLKDRLNYLKTVKRYEIADRIKVALGYGDLSENAEYDEAKQEQGFVEAEINQIENVLKDARIIYDDEISIDVISIGSVVKMRNESNKKEYEYRIVGSSEANIAEGKISNEAPIGRGLLGHRKGEVVAIDTPAGTVHYRILEIRR